ncbi:FAD-dependent monooxygenase [Streptomyces sp. 184]|uniref:FAD-dependent monooxygenase n=1 Tax=Streptomyces sp. 184 TaxID=1827526 RepID=UPI0038920ECB
MTARHSSRGRRRRGDAEVLVAGAGPTGLTLACELLRRGVAVRLIDRAEEPMRAPKALSLWPRALDILDDLGVGAAVTAASTPIRAFSYFSDGRPLATFGFAPGLASRTLPQYETERLLTERLHELGGKIERGVRLVSLDDAAGRAARDPDGGPAVGLEHPDGSPEHIRVPYVAGADGASSTVRRLLGIGFEGSTYEMAFALIDARTSGGLPADEVLYYQAAAGTLVVVPMPGGVFRFLAVLPEGRPMSVELMQQLVDERGPRVRITEPVWETVFRVHARHAESFRAGRAFLLGDAAHVHSPAGGQGMNNGLQDAGNLGWKLAAVLRGDAPPHLLESYGPERIQATRRIVRDTDLQTRAWMVRGGLRKGARDLAFRLLERTGAVSRFYAPVMAGRRLHYPPARTSQAPSRGVGCLLARHVPGAVRVGGAVPRGSALAKPHGTTAREWLLAVRPPAGAAAWQAELGRLAASYPQLHQVRVDRDELRAAGACARPGFHLVRPDGHVAAHGHAGDLERLRAELAAVLLPRAGAPADDPAGKEPS